VTVRGSATLHERVVVTRAAAETQALGEALARVARPGDVVCLNGPLGAGKTQLAKGFGAGLGVTDPIVSPSFVLMAEYEGRLRLFHLDLYRIDDIVDAIESGLVDEREAAGVMVVEWADRLGPALPRRRLDVAIAGSGDDPRTFRFRATDEDLTRYLDALDDEGSGP
jgi:tRNA threonylcarbamoyladenosine biosynthesis protein TsaE